MTRFRIVAGLAIGLLLAPLPAAAKSPFGYNWDALGEEFCRLTRANDMAGVAALLSPQLLALLRQAAGRGGLPEAQTLFQTYVNVVPECSVSTRNAALVEIRRSGPGGAPAWSDYLVITPEPDGTSRIDDVLFATRKSDTLRARLAVYAGQG